MQTISVNNKIAKKWHLVHHVPKNATIEQRIPYTPIMQSNAIAVKYLKEEMKKRNIKMPVGL
jgi:hypothetical protein